MLTLTAALAFDRETFGADAWSEKVWAETLASSHRHVLVLRATAPDALTAMAVVSFTGGDAELERIAVRPDARRAGLGRRLLAAAVAQARTDGADRLLLEVSTGNTAAIGLYRSAGAQELTIRPGYYADGGDAAVLSIDVRQGP